MVLFEAPVTARPHFCNIDGPDARGHAVWGAGAEACFGVLFGVVVRVTLGRIFVGLGGCCWGAHQVFWHRRALARQG